MGQSVRRRRHGLIEYQANATDTLRLSRGMILRALYLNFSGQLDDPNNANATLGRGDEWAVVRRIRVIANGTDVLVDMDGNALWWQNFFLYGTKPLVSPLMGAAGADPTFESHLILPFWMPRSVRPIDTALDTRILSDLVIEVTWGSHLNVQSTATGWITDPTIEVHALESFGLPRNTRFAQWRRWRISQEITATNQRFEVDLPVGNVYRGFLINTTDDDGAAAATDSTIDVNDILNRIAVRSGNVEFHAMDAHVFQHIGWMEYGIDRDWDDNLSVYDPLRMGPDNSVLGWYVIDHVTDGYLTEGIDTAGFSEFKLELDVTAGAGTVMLNVYPQLVVPVRGAA